MIIDILNEILAVFYKPIRDPDIVFQFTSKTDWMINLILKITGNKIKKKQLVKLQSKKTLRRLQN